MIIMILVIVMTLLMIRMVRNRKVIFNMAATADVLTVLFVTQLRFHVVIMVLLVLNEGTLLPCRKEIDLGPNYLKNSPPTTPTPNLGNGGTLSVQHFSGSKTSLLGAGGKVQL